MIRLILWVYIVWGLSGYAYSQDVGESDRKTARRFFVTEYRVAGVTVMPQEEIEKAVYPYLGPMRTAEDVGKARLALEQLYQKNGYQTATVFIPQQEVADGVIKLEVNEGEVNRLRVYDSRYYDIEKIKEKVPSAAEGKVLNFDHLIADLVDLNQVPNRYIVPELKPGDLNQVDVDLVVKDESPLKGSVELNNRYSADTTKLRFNASLSYENLWQKSHSIGATVQSSPLDLNEVLVYSVFYTFRFEDLERFNLTLRGTKQDTDIATSGGAAVVGRGNFLSLAGQYILPSITDNHFHSINATLSFKDSEQIIFLRNDPDATPIQYYPLNVMYSSIWSREHSMTELYSGFTLNFRGIGSDPQIWDDNRFDADGGFLIFNADMAHTHDLPNEFEIYNRFQFQLASHPLISNEQFSAGGLNTARGYLEAQSLGDHGAGANFELRSPNLLGDADDENLILFYGFLDSAYVTLLSPLPEQERKKFLLSSGFGSRVKWRDTVSGEMVLGFPLKGEGDTRRGDSLLTFLLRGEF